MTPPAGRLWWLGAAAAVLKRPDLWPIAVVEARSLVPPGWWRSWPPLPRTPAGWLGFRMETAYGDRDARPTTRDVVAWLEWCREARPGSVRGRHT